MRVGRTYNGYTVLREMDTFLKELRLSGYKVTDFRRQPSLSLLEITDPGLRISVYLRPPGEHTVYFLGFPGKGGPFYWTSTEELEDLIMEKLNAVGK